MTERAAHLVDTVLPRVPVRQWVLSLPHWLRYGLAWDHQLCRAVLAAYVRTLLAFQRRRGARAGCPGGRAGSVTVIQRFGGALNLNVHFHTLVLAGVFTTDAGGTVHFHAMPPPTACCPGCLRCKAASMANRRGKTTSGGGRGWGGARAPVSEKGLYVAFYAPVPRGGSPCRGVQASGGHSDEARTESPEETRTPAAYLAA